jgi:hypothetical protein
MAAAVLAAASSACSGGDDKNACETQLDCVEGYLCELPEEGGGMGTCERIGGWDPGDDDDDETGGDDDDSAVDGGTGPGEGPEYGEYYPFPVMTWGARGRSWIDLGVTSVEGGLGCALVTDEDAVPGRQAAQVLVRFAPYAEDACPEGSFGLQSASSCANDLDVVDLQPDCAVYRAWNDAGEQVSQLFAVGGGATVTESGQRCTIMFEVTFPGGNTVTETFGFDFDPYDYSDEDPLFCGH